MARLNGFRERTRRLALRAAKRARAERAGLRAEHPVPDRRHHRRRVPLRLPRDSARSSSTPSSIRDVREVQSIAILIAAIYIVVNMLADLLVVCSSRSSGRRHEERLRFAPHGDRASSGSCSLVLVVGAALCSGPFFAPHSPDRDRSGSRSSGRPATRRSARTRSGATCSRASSGAGGACSALARLATAARLRRRARDRPRRRLLRARSPTRC